MPLHFSGEVLDWEYVRNPRPLVLNERYHLKFKELAAVWSSGDTITLGSDILYVSQREYAVIDPESKGNIKYIATDSATTCHILVLLHPETQVVGLAHFDGCSTNQGVRRMLALMDKRVSHHKPSAGDENSHCYDVYMFGGFDDEKRLSNKLSQSLLEALHEQIHKLNIKVLCIGHLNTCKKNDIRYPIYYGVGVKLDSLEICRVVCQDHGPLSVVKSCRNFVGPKSMSQSYDCSTMSMFVEPFHYTPLPDVHLWLQQSDSFLLKYLSTSPEQEPPDFVSQTREALQFMVDHPEPLQTVFKNNKTYKFKLVDGDWKEEIS